MAKRRKRQKKYVRKASRTRRSKQQSSEMEILIFLILMSLALIATLQQSGVLTGAGGDFDPRAVVVTILSAGFLLLGGICVGLLIRKAYRHWTHRQLKKRKRQAQIATFEAARVRNSYALIDWRQMEEYVGYVFERQGYDVTVTQGSNDGGLDAILRKDGITTVVQVKHYKDNVGRPDVNKFVGAMHGYEAGIFVTTSDYSSGARAYAATVSNLTLYTGRELRAMHDALD